MNIIYDIESYPNLFLVVMCRADTRETHVFEMSDRVNDIGRLVKTVRKLGLSFAKMVGFNNTFYDYPVLHHIIEEVQHRPNYHSGGELARLAYLKTEEIILNTPYDERWSHVVWDSKQLAKQVDLFRVHHFDNAARATSLKVLEFNMRAASIQDLPYKPGTRLTPTEIDHVIDYCGHDVAMTADFYDHSKEQLKFREELTKRYGRNFMNHNDTKIGKDYFIMRLEESNIECYEYIEGVGRKPIQTKRSEGIDLADVILPLVHFERPEFQAVLDWISAQHIKQTKSVFTEIDFDGLGALESCCNLKKKKGKLKNLNCIVDGFQFDFGTGGIHGSVESTIAFNDDDWTILDLDVTSYYPSIAISHDLYPAHLGPGFVNIYAAMKRERVSYPKDSAPNAMLKLALNGVYGDSNSKFSPFYDPQYTMSITINGQLMLAMLAERLMVIASLSMLQINTDGMTVRLRRSDVAQLDAICERWEQLTDMVLERAEYKRMFIRDVNNYIGEYVDGKLKRKGAYEYDIGWHQNHSMLVVPKAAEACLLKGVSVEQFIHEHDDVFDFMLRTKVPRTSKLVIDKDGHERQLQNTTRYYVSTSGGELTKVMPALKKSKTGEDRRIGIHKGYKTTPMNTMRPELKPSDLNIDFKFYIDECQKLVDPLVNGLFQELQQ